MSEWKEAIGQYLLYDPQFLALWRDTGIVPVYFMSEFEGQEEENLLFATHQISRGPLRRYQSLIDGLPARVMTTADNSRPTPELVVGALRALACQGGLKHVWVDFDNAIRGGAIGSNWKASTAITQVIDEGAIRRKALASATGRHIRSGGQRGATVVRLSDGAEAALCYEIVRNTERSRGKKPRYPESLYRRLAEFSMRDPRVIWFLCSIDAEIIGFHICLRVGEELLSWQPYINRERREFKPAYVLMDKVLDIARAEGVKRINLGGSPAEAAGLREFKRRFGAIEYEYKVYTHLSPAGRALSGIVR